LHASSDVQQSRYLYYRNYFHLRPPSLFRNYFAALDREDKKNTGRLSVIEWFHSEKKLSAVII
jgi:hypothetical protein